MQAQGVDHLWLDLRPVGRERLERQFPTILGRCRNLGLDPTAAPIPVAPAAHYWMGGIATDLQAATSLPGLYAVGEVACTGVHGANRLASNSLMECLVFARQLASVALQALPPQRPDGPGRSWQAAGEEELLEPQQAISQLRQLCWNVAGVERLASSLSPALKTVTRQLAQLRHSPLLRASHDLEPGQRLELTPAQLQALLSQQNLHQRLVLARLLIEAALFRTESRGGHFRTDAPASSLYWRRHTVQTLGRRPGTVAVSDHPNERN
jgi:L-aspartate oxidase